MTARTDGMLAGREASELLQGALKKLSPELRKQSSCVISKKWNTGRSRRCYRCRKVPSNRG